MRGPGRFLVAGGTLVLFVALAGCGSASAPAPSPVAPAGLAASAPATGTTAPSPSAGSTAPGLVVYGDVPVSGTRTVRVRCEGHGTPTILLEAGGTASNLDDFPVAFLDKLAATTTVCVYSRAGGNGSPPMTGPVTMPAYLADADALLTALRVSHGIDGPYVFVGWSFGGSVALAEASEDASRTAGLVILDTDFPADFLKACKAGGRSAATCQALFDDDREAKTIEQSLQPMIHPLPAIPIALVSALQPGPDCTLAPGATTVTADIDGKVLSARDCRALFSLIADIGLRDWRRLGSQVVQTRVEATHDGLIWMAGDTVAAVILGLVTRARSGPGASP